MYYLGLCENYLPFRHGENVESYDKFIVLDIFKTNNINDMIKYTTLWKKLFKVYLKTLNLNKISHPTIRNIKQILLNKNYINLEILEIYHSETNECLCIKKTFWIKIFQRKIKQFLTRNYLKYKNLKRIKGFFSREIGKISI